MSLHVCKAVLAVLAVFLVSQVSSTIKVHSYWATLEIHGKALTVLRDGALDLAGIDRIPRPLH